MTVVALIPARGGSKGIPRKNITPLAGVPTVVRAIETAQRVERINDVLVSTDDASIAEISRSALATVIDRPAALADDHTPMIDVVQHALAWCDANDVRGDVFILLQPTAPLRTSEDIDAALRRLDEDDGVDAVVSVTPVPVHHHGAWQFREDHSGRLVTLDGEDPATVPARRQSLPAAFVRNGAIYAVRIATLRDTGSLYGRTAVAHVMPPERSINLDDPADWLAADAALRTPALVGDDLDVSS